MRTTPRRLLTLAVPLAILIAACSGSGASTAPSAVPPTDAPTSAPPEAPSDAPSEAPAATTVALSTSPLGSILVDAEGRTLYGFTKDTDGVSTCYETCAQNWPALSAASGATVGAGLNASLLTTVDRTDGTKQVKYGDWPLYYFAADSAAGDTNGQGVGGIWFVVGADGSLIGQ